MEWMVDSEFWIDQISRETYANVQISSDLNTLHWKVFMIIVDDIKMSCVQFEVLIKSLIRTWKIKMEFIP